MTSSNLNQFFGIYLIWGLPCAFVSCRFCYCWWCVLWTRAVQSTNSVPWGGFILLRSPWPPVLGSISSNGSFKHLHGQRLLFWRTWIHISCQCRTASRTMILLSICKPDDLMEVEARLINLKLWVIFWSIHQLLGSVDCKILIFLRNCTTTQFSQREHSRSSTQLHSVGKWQLPPLATEFSSPRCHRYRHVVNHSSCSSIKNLMANLYKILGGTLKLNVRQSFFPIIKLWKKQLLENSTMEINCRGKKKVNSRRLCPS